MAFNDKVTRLLRGRYTPFFLPIIGSLVFVALAILLVPDEIGGSSTGGKDVAGEDSEPAPNASAHQTGDAASKTSSAAARRRARLASRAAKKLAPAAPPNAPAAANADEPPSPNSAAE